MSGGETQLSLAVDAVNKALNKAGLQAKDLDCIVSASAVSVQPIPCTAALIYEEIAQGTVIPALDINTTRTSFVTAVDTMSYLIAVGRYKCVLIVSSDAASYGLNPKYYSEETKEEYVFDMNGK